jgi:hypothetical protein
MEFFGDLSVPVKFVIAVVVALAILGAGGYLIRRFRPGRTEPRLEVINAASVDGRRRLVLVRRDNVEHLLLIGGPTDRPHPRQWCGRPCPASRRARR